VALAPSLGTAWPEPSARSVAGRRGTGQAGSLRDGSTVLIRQVHSTDGRLLADCFSRLSARSRQLRFLTPKQELSLAEVRYVTDEG
jgi:hypothetical protein